MTIGLLIFTRDTLKMVVRRTEHAKISSKYLQFELVSTSWIWEDWVWITIRLKVELAWVWVSQS